MQWALSMAHVLLCLHVVRDAQGQDKAAAGGDQILSSQKGDPDGAADAVAGIPVKAVANGVAHDDVTVPPGAGVLPWGSELLSTHAAMILCWLHSLHPSASKSSVFVRLLASPPKV